MKLTWRAAQTLLLLSCLTNAPLALSVCPGEVASLSWPTDGPPPQGEERLAIGPLLVTPSAGWHQIHALTNSGVGFSYGEGRRLSFQWLPSSEVVGHQSIDLRRLYAETFCDTPDRESALAAEARAMRDLSFKGLHYVGRMESGPFTAYLAEIRLGSFDSRTVLLHDEEPKYVLEILGSGFSVDQLQELITKIHSREGGDANSGRAE